MQLFSLSALLPALQAAVPSALPSADALTADYERIVAGFRPGFFLLWFAVLQAISIVAYWISSNLITREHGSILNALKLWAFYLLSTLGVAILFAFTAGYGVKQSSNALLFAAIVVGIMLAIVVVLGCPMKVYKMGVGGAIGFVLISWILTAAGQVAATRVLPQPIDFRAWGELSQKLAQLPAVERNKLVERFTQRTPTAAAAPAAADSDDAIAANKTKPIEVRHEAIQRIYHALEARRVALKPGDTAALAAYTRDEARYQQLLSQLQTDAAAAAPR